MKVKCINADFSQENQPDLVKAILLVGDDHLLPKEGQEYEVIGYAHFENGIEAYELAEIDTLEYGYDKKLVFKKSRFVVSDDTFVPNAVLDDFVSCGSGLCRKVNFYMELKINSDLKGDYIHEPRKD